MVEVVPASETQTADLLLAWPLPPTQVEPAGDEVHVWSAWLGRAEADSPADLEMLCEEERARAGRFHFERDRKNFIARRSWLRAVLGGYLKVEASKVPLAYEERGKPRFAGPEGAAAFHFNFTHSRNLALCAVGRPGPLGVDVEQIRLMPEMAEIGATFCSVRENALIAAAPPEKKLQVFFSLWTRKEAYLKGTGEGIAGSLAALDCSESPPGWSLHELRPAPGFVGALACAGGAIRLKCWQWSGGGLFSVA